MSLLITDFDPVFYAEKHGPVTAALEAPGPLPDPYIGDDLRKAVLAMEVEVDGVRVRLEHRMGQSQLEAFSMSVRRALAYMREGKGR